MLRAPRVSVMVALVAVFVACAGTRTRHEIPTGLVHVLFSGINEAASEQLSGREAVKLREKVVAEWRRTAQEEGHVAWFFHAFDEEELYFLMARWEGDPAVGGTYHVMMRYEVRRTPRIERALEVADEIAEYERGVGQVHAGMSLQEVQKVRGAPDQVQELGPVGAFDYVYKDLCVRFLEGRVAHLWPPETCRQGLAR